MHNGGGAKNLQKVCTRTHARPGVGPEGERHVGEIVPVDDLDAVILHGYDSHMGEIPHDIHDAEGIHKLRHRSRPGSAPRLILIIISHANDAVLPHFHCRWVWTLSSLGPSSHKPCKVLGVAVT